MSNKNKEDNEVESPSNSEKTLVVSGQLKKQIQNKRKRWSKTKPERGVVFIKNIPHGFYEEQIKNYFKQFGKVTRVRLVRSKRTGHDKGFAYVELQYPEVAEEAAKSIHNRVMFKKILKAVHIPPEEQKFDYFKTGLKAVQNTVGKLKFVSIVNRHRMETTKAANYWVPENYFSRVYRKSDSVKKIREAFSAFGLDPNLVPDNPKILGIEDIADQINEMDAMKEKILKELEEKEEKKRKQREAEQEKLLKNNRKGGNDDSNGEPDAVSPKIGQLLLIKKRQRSSEKEQSGHNGSVAKETPKDSRNKKSLSSTETDLEKSVKKKIKDRSYVAVESISKKVRTQSTEQDSAQKGKVTKPKRELEVKDLLDATFEVDDSDDDDFIPGKESDDEVEDDTDKTSCNSSPTKGEDYEEQPINYVQISKPRKVEKPKKILKRNPHSGKVQKPTKKANKDKAAASKTELKVAALKEIMKEGVKPQINKKAKRALKKR